MSPLSGVTAGANDPMTDQRSTKDKVLAVLQIIFGLAVGLIIARLLLG